MATTAAMKKTPGCSGSAATRRPAPLRPVRVGLLAGRATRPAAAGRGGSGRAPPPSHSWGRPPFRSRNTPGTGRCGAARKRARYTLPAAWTPWISSGGLSASRITSRYSVLPFFGEGDGQLVPAGTSGTGYFSRMPDAITCTWCGPPAAAGHLDSTGRLKLRLLVVSVTGSAARAGTVMCTVVVFAFGSRLTVKPCTGHGCTRSLRPSSTSAVRQKLTELMRNGPAHHGRRTDFRVAAALPVLPRQLRQGDALSSAMLPTSIRNWRQHWRAAGTSRFSMSMKRV